MPFSWYTRGFASLQAALIKELSSLPSAWTTPWNKHDMSKKNGVKAMFLRIISPQNSL